MTSREKSPDALRTISEVSRLLDVPQHVLRFWETRFPHLSPMKRGGNRRYYRPADIALLRAIDRLLRVDGYTIKGVQRLLRRDGVRALIGDAAPVSGESISGESGAQHAEMPQDAAVDSRRDPEDAPPVAQSAPLADVDSQQAMPSPVMQASIMQELRAVRTLLQQGLQAVGRSVPLNGALPHDNRESET